MNNNKILWITRTAVITALLITLQISTSVFGNTLITGSIVNLVLVVCVITCGLTSGITVAAISPVCAKLIGIGPLWALIPIIILGNIVFVSTWHIMNKYNLNRKKLFDIGIVIVSALLKFVVLYIGVVRILIPIFLKLPEPQASVISNVFSLPQLFTALTGGAIALIILPVLQKAINKR